MRQISSDQIITLPDSFEKFNLQWLISSPLNIGNQQKQGKVAKKNKKRDSRSYSLYKMVLPRSFGLQKEIKKT